MLQTDINFIQNAWREKLKNLAEDATFNLFIDNPFCIDKCEFCVYKSEKNLDGSIYKKYYTEYLPWMIKDFQEIIKLKIPDSIYFGDGTASLMSPKIMKDIFALIPNFENILNKVFECHPMRTDEQKIDILGKHKFSYLSFGIQTLNEKILEREKRLPINALKFASIINNIRRYDIKINFDLLAFLPSGTLEDLAQLKEDLYQICSIYKPDIITIYPMYQKIAFDLNEHKKIEEKCTLILELRKLLDSCESELMDYHVAFKDHNLLSLDFKDILFNLQTNYYLTKMSDQEFTKVKQYSSSGYPRQLVTQNVLALGGFGKRTPYSYHGRNGLYYIVKNIDWVPHYIIPETK